MITKEQEQCLREKYKLSFCNWLIVICILAPIAGILWASDLTKGYMINLANTMVYYGLVFIPNVKRLIKRGNL